MYVFFKIKNKNVCIYAYMFEQASIKLVWFLVFHSTPNSITCETPINVTHLSPGHLLSQFTANQVATIRMLPAQDDKKPIAYNRAMQSLDFYILFFSFNRTLKVIKIWFSNVYEILSFEWHQVQERVRHIRAKFSFNNTYIQWLKPTFTA